jgi:hypothetical protein
MSDKCCHLPDGTGRICGIYPMGDMVPDDMLCAACVNFINRGILPQNVHPRLGDWWIKHLSDVLKHEKAREADQEKMQTLVAKLDFINSLPEDKKALFRYDVITEDDK